MLITPGVQIGSGVVIGPGSSPPPPSGPTIVQTNLTGLNVSGQGTNTLLTTPATGSLLIGIGFEYTGIHSINSGWTEIFNVGEGYDNIVAAYRIVQAGDTNVFNWLYTGGGSYAGMVAMWNITGFNPGTFVDLTFQNQTSVTTTYSPTIGSTNYTNEIVLSLIEAASVQTITPDGTWTTDQYASPVYGSDGGGGQASTGRTGLMSHKTYAAAGAVSQTVTFSAPAIGEMGIVSIRSV